ncbi:MAG: hypothetical protein ACI9N1_002291 [Flavobacteriales bacterium]|jgi:hypothetical protein
MNYKTIDINIIKKNRKYFSAEINCRKVKVEIDDNSEKLGIGEYSLYVEDISIRSKYGTDEKYRLAVDMEKQKSTEVYSLQSTVRNSFLIDACRRLGGRYDTETSSWIFNAIVADKAEELDLIHNSELINIEIAAISDIQIYGEPIRFCGFTIAQARGRDTGAILGDNVHMLEGDINSGGSAKNWTTNISEKSVFRLEVPEELLKQEQDNESITWDIKML